MSQPPTKKTAKKKPNATSTPDSTKHKAADALSALEKAIDIINKSSALNERMLERERPLLDFHEAIDDISDSDVRVYWDVRVVRGANTPFTRTSGVSSMPGLLSAKMKSHAPSHIEQEVLDKIAHPLVASFMEEAEVQNADNLSRIANRPLLTHNVDASASESSGDKIMRLASQQAGDSVAASEHIPEDDEDAEDEQ